MAEVVEVVKPGRITVTLHRTQERIRKVAIQEGRNLPVRYKFDIEATKLPVVVLSALYDAYGRIPAELSGLNYGRDYQLVRDSSYIIGKVEFICDDGDNVVDAIVRAFAELDQKKEDAAKEEAEREKRTKEKVDQWLSFPEGERASTSGVCVCLADGKLSNTGIQFVSVSDVKKYAPEEFQRAVELAASLRQKREVEELRNDLKEVKKQRDCLARFLKAIDESAKEQVIRNMAEVDAESQFELIKGELEEASPTVWLFQQSGE